ncbi:hypothetical protein COV93_01750 [Candidatus Woesearchaeota archaeon CG11_big_fil_rev_8_21_14_0_20_43_8]|nr:MAG: hypothetical protein COV93_01750 [Candidatus Woesearchaeota archaeon CG11_big_fil_rev_8_21_14_0_20_43_8]
MSLTNEMIGLFKTIHREIFFTLLFHNCGSEIVTHCMHHADDMIKEILNLLTLKKNLNENERKELDRIGKDINEIYDAIDKNQLDERYHKLLEKVKSEELKMVKEAIDERDINMRIEEALGKLQDVIKKLFDHLNEYKFEYLNHKRSVNSNMFDAIFRMADANGLLPKLEMIREQYREECYLMGEVEETEKLVLNGEMDLQEMLDRVGIDPAKEGIDMEKMTPEDLKTLLLRIAKLTKAMEDRKKEG